MALWTNVEVRAMLQLVAEMATESYVVGGAIRDRLLDVSSTMDLDLSVQGNGFEIARRVAAALGRGASFVPLDEERGTGRVVLKSEDITTLDISSFKGRDIYEDLKHRDFTINAIGVKVCNLLETGLTHMVDPHGGVSDIRDRRVRACSARTFLDDPIRILRAFRFGASLGFQISERTLAMIPPCLGALTEQSPERIRDEFLASLCTDSAASVLKEMDRQNVLDTLFPEVLPMKGCRQNDYHHLDVWDHTLETVEQLESILRSAPNAFGDSLSYLQAYLTDEPVPGRSRVALLKLAALFHDSGKPRCATVDDTARIRFFGHEKVSLEIFRGVGHRLRLAKRELRIVGNWIVGHMRTMVLLHEMLSKRAVLRLFNTFDEDVLGLLLLFLADLGASKGSARRRGKEELAQQRVREVLGLYLSRKPPRKPLVNGRDLMRAFGIAPGPYLGSLLRHLSDLRECGDLCTREQAFEAARTWIEKSGVS